MFRIYDNVINFIWERFSSSNPLYERNISIGENTQIKYRNANIKLN